MEQSKGGYMRKRIISMLCICICILSLAACGTDPKDMDYNGYSYEELKSYATGSWESIQATDLTQVEAVLAQIDAMSEAERISTYEANEGLEEEVILMRGWVSVSKEAGDYIGVDRFVVAKSGKSTTTELYLDFENRDVVYSIVYKNRDMSVEASTVDLVYSTGEKVEKALLNTVMGMGTVFIMLIVICLIIYCFTFISKIEAKLKGNAQTKEKTEVAKPVVSAPAEVVIPATDNFELVAVIAAAIAASTGQSTDDFVVRSIKRR